MKLLTKPKQLQRWEKKNKISNKRFAKLTGLDPKKLKRSKKLPKFVGLSCLAIESAKKKSDAKKAIQSLKKKNANLKAKVIKLNKPLKKLDILKKSKKKLESKLKKPKKTISKLKNINKKLASKLKKPKKTISKLKNTNKKLVSKLKKPKKTISKLKNNNKKLNKKISSMKPKKPSKSNKLKATKPNGSLDKVSAQNINIKTDITSPTSATKKEEPSQQ